jgi:hypothetical protein
MLNISDNPHKEVLVLKHNMLKALKKFNSSIANEPEVRIGIKAQKLHIYLTPHVAQPAPY